MNSFGASEGDTPKPWWRTQKAHDRLRAYEARARKLTGRPGPHDIAADVAGLDASPEEVRRMRTATSVPVFLETEILMAVIQEDYDKASGFLDSMAPKDRAVLQFYLAEISDLIGDAEARRAAERT